MKWVNGIRYVAFVTPTTIVRCVGDEKLCLSDPVADDAWIAAEQPVDLRNHC